jgi:hypothetical protein
MSSVVNQPLERGVAAAGSAGRRNAAIAREKHHEEIE